MRAMTRDMVVLERYCARSPMTLDLRLPPAWRPALLTSLRLGMGAAVGGAFGAAAGHGAFWLVVGTALGVALEAIGRRA